MRKRKHPVQSTFSKMKWEIEHEKELNRKMFAEIRSIHKDRCKDCEYFNGWICVVGKLEVCQYTFLGRLKKFWKKYFEA